MSCPTDPRPVGDRSTLEVLSARGSAQPAPLGQTRLQQAVLVVVTIVWGASFLVIQHGLSFAEPVSFVAVRFLLAALAMAAVTGRCLARVTRTELVGGTLIGAALAAGNGLQAVGLLTITSSTSAFLTALYVPVVPVLAWMFTGRAPSRSVWTAVILAFAGVGAMSGVSPSAIGVGQGEVLTLLCAVAIGGEILLLGRFAPHVNIKRITVVQLATCGVLCAMSAPLVGESVPSPSWGLVATAGALAVTSALIQLSMSWAQASVTAVRATVIYAGEPVWAGLIGGLAGERFTSGFVIGAALVILALLVPALAQGRPPKPTKIFGLSPRRR